MSLLSYVVNWDELALSLATDITVDVGDLGGVIDSNLPDVTDLLEQIRDILYLNGAKYKNYDQKIEGFHLKTEQSVKTIDWVNEENCYLTGVTCSHSHVEAVDDFFMLSLIKLDEETGEEAIELIFEKVYLKDALQHKYFNKYFPVPAGVTVRITHNNPSNLNKHVWYDLEYLEFFGLREDEEWEDIPTYEPTERPGMPEANCSEISNLSFHLVPFDRPVFDNGIPVSAGVYISKESFLSGMSYDVFGYKFKLSLEIEGKQTLKIIVSEVDTSASEYHKHFRLMLFSINYLKDGEEHNIEYNSNKELIVERDNSFYEKLGFDICHLKSGDNYV